MKTAIAALEGIGAISFSYRHEKPMLEGESHGDYDQRTWREKLHYDPTTKEIFVPGMMLKFALDYTAQQLGIKIQGRGIKTWHKIFQSGVICPDRMMLGINYDKVESITIQANADGRRGSGKRVPRIFPIINNGWSGEATFLILNDMITEDIFRLHLIKAGQFCGLGRYAPRVGGYHGRFNVKELLWQDEVAEAAVA
jgi:hypothetical protein